MNIFTTLNKAKPNTGNKRGLKFGGAEAYDLSNFQTAVIL